MKVITVKQPFATLIAEGLKEYEFRTWRTKFRGDILIHAGKGIDKKAMERYKHLNLDYPSGKIIAKATITDCVYVDDNLKEELQEKDPLVYYGILQKDSDWDGYGFKLENIEKIEPIEINGKLSLWDYDYKDE
ncbi:MAG: ASCH domain-containing protein [Bacilli bacterium]|nr:ASCH domain-containing protein [Bacilli bacterium]